MKKLILLLSLLSLSSCASFKPMSMLCERDKSGNLTLNLACDGKPVDPIYFDCNDDITGYEIGVGGECGLSKIECYCK